jgi:hypothetical protein
VARRRRDGKTRRPPPLRRRRRALIFASRWGKWLTAGGIATIATAATLVFTLFPSVKPSPPCPAQGAELSNPFATDSVTRGDYLSRINANTTSIPTARLAERGELITFQIRTRGYLHQPLTVATRVLTIHDTPVAGPGLNNPLALTVQPEKCEDEGQRTIWTLLPKHPGRYQVELRLLDPNGQELPSPPPIVVSVRG